tara:strand:- start:7791 stop:8114 length:324 start_codon:yes stop_codon:yes gene_type:complete
MNKTDEDIIRVLKDVFQLRKIDPMVSDHNTRIGMIRTFFALSLLCITLRIFLAFYGRDITSDISKIINIPIAFFFTLLFWHLNNESENPSIIMFFLTWAALMIGLYV